jgi:hypothetical protein
MPAAPAQLLPPLLPPLLPARLRMQEGPGGNGAYKARRGQGPLRRTSGSKAASWWFGPQPSPQVAHGT